MLQLFGQSKLNILELPNSSQQIRQGNYTSYNTILQYKLLFSVEETEILEPNRNNQYKDIIELRKVS